MPANTTDDTTFANAPPSHAPHFMDVEGIRITGHNRSGGRCAYLYMDETAEVPTLVIQCDRVRVVADTADLRGRVVVVHAGEVLKTDCAGVGTRFDAAEVSGTVVRRDWDGNGLGSGYQRHAPEIPLEGPTLHIEADG